MSINVAELTAAERWEYLTTLLREGKGPKAGRPRKDAPGIKWSDFGLTRQKVWNMRRMGEVPQNIHEAFIAERRAKGKPVTAHGLLVRGGKINVIDNDVFEGTRLGELAETALESAEQILGDMRPSQRRWFLRALAAQLKKIKLKLSNDFEE